MAYKVVNRFVETQHNSELYEAGDTYPKEGYKADPERVAFLQTSNNKYSRVFLGEEVDQQDDESPENKGSEEEIDLAQLSAAELKKVTNDDLRAYLDKNKINYDSDDIKEDLIKRVMNNK
ncbi:hypothetical protein [Pseudalkalibacillus caeni]|uniref:T4 recombination endonuclease VII dimerisation domain-containing protein n=1 Tax=Exobacillus caeni TaxID=2574798 RepID=A0A5R9FA56_9BACL|nr:hypothetical protein [Pseudalkalibacillus caeni]TLS37743.1 hypothetical protein FCL54_07930 [Pseudalkalibacillus caeni]